MNELARLLRRQLVADVVAAPARVRARAQGIAAVEQCASVAELRTRARRVVPRAIFDFVDGAAGDEVTARRNEEAFRRIVFAPRALADVSSIDLGTTVLGEPVRLPVLGAPTGLTGMVHPDGEIGVARAVHAAGGVYVLSSMASCALEEVTAATSGPIWFQLYMWRDRGLVRELIARSYAAGHQALVLTIDVPFVGARERDRRNGFGIPPRLTLRTLADAVRRPRWTAAFVRRPRITVANAVGHGRGAGDAASLVDYISRQFDASLSWEDLRWLRGEWDRPLVVKGVMNGEDAARAVGEGVDAVIVSNHGGRQLDHAPSSIAALPGVVAAVGEDAEVYLDGGVRRGADVVKAVALGARAVLSGRALVYGLAAGGERGVGRAMSCLGEELRLAMALLGCPAISQLDGAWLAAPARADVSKRP